MNPQMDLPESARRERSGAHRLIDDRVADVANCSGDPAETVGAAGQAPNFRRALATAWHGGAHRELRSLCGAINPRLGFWTACARLLPEFSLARIRAACYRLGGCDIASGVTLQGSPVLLGKGPVAARLHIGQGSIVAPHVTFGLDADITIGRNVSIGPGAALYTGTHAIGFGSRRMQLDLQARPIVIGDGVWIGVQGIILPGITIGRGSIVSAGAVINESVPPNTLVAGSPASVVQHLPFGNR